MPADSWYSRAARRWRKTHQGKPPTDSGGRDLLTGNKIAGPSWDVPVAATCAPSAVCAVSCYAINPSRPITWSGAINRQHLRLTLATEDPTGTAERIAQEVQRRKLDHLTINGTGDLLGDQVPAAARCPLHDRDPARPRASLVGACAACRRCFDGSLVQEQARLGRFVSAVVPA